MALSQYTRNSLLAAVRDSYAEPSLNSQIVLEDALNKAARAVYLDVDIKSSKRVAIITPNIFDDIYRYTSPSDLKDYAVIDVRPQAYPNRTLNSRIRLVSPEVFDRKKSANNLLVAIEDDDNTQKLLLNIDVDDDVDEISNLDSLTEDGSNWALFGSATNVAIDTNRKVEGNASIGFDLDTGTTAGIYNAGISPALAIGTEVFNSGVGIVWAYINSMATAVTNFILRVGSSDANYYQVTETTDISGNTFVAGFNALRFDFADKVTTGTPDNGAIAYVALYMTKPTDKADDGYRFDDLKLHLGEIYEVMYYSKFPWQNDSQTYLENSTSGTDYINASAQELDGIAARARMEIARRKRDYEEYNLAKQDYEEWKNTYQLKNPSERLIVENVIDGYA